MSKTMLLLGGTGWLGPEIVRTALGAGWSVTTLTRGRSGPVPPGAHCVIGDRTEPDGYDGVADRDWDIVMDTSWQPGMVRSAMDALSRQAGHWIYVSSVAVYAGSHHPRRPDRCALAAPLASDTAQPSEYAQAKVACEQAVNGVGCGRCLIARSGLIAGPGDVSDRYGYWVSRFASAKGGPVLVPASQQDQVQLIDVRDLASWLVAAAGDSLTGTLDAVGPRYELGELIEVSRQIAQFAGETVAVPDEFLHEQDVRAAPDGPRALPLWNPSSAVYPVISTGPILATGVRYRPLAQTTRDTLDDERGRGLERERRAGLSRADELAVIRAYLRS